ncbi:potassium channel subfamily K member 15-like [Ptychodera flava]|uniref:potassium channel subfamily K member 15-like n=1 Tax=Ptychodera flava TaxID=63121 RepID=UPI00396A94AA
MFLFIEAPHRQSVELDRTELRLQLLGSLRSLRNVHQENWTLVVDDVIELLEPVIEDYTAPSTWREWNFATCLYLTVTAITTIGYGDIAPMTQTGRIVMLFYSLIGIPLNLIFLSNFGDLLFKLTRRILKKIIGKDTESAGSGSDIERKDVKECENEAIPMEPIHTLKDDKSGQTDKGDTSKMKSRKDSTDSSDFGIEGNVLGILSVIYLLYTVLAALFMFYTEQDWTFIDAVYCTFISLTTIGFGDLIPGGGTLKEYSVLRPVTYLFFTYAGLIILSATIHASPAKIKSVAKAMRERVQEFTCSDIRSTCRPFRGTIGITVNVVKVRHSANHEESDAGNERPIRLSQVTYRYEEKNPYGDMK